MVAASTICAGSEASSDGRVIDHLVGTRNGGGGEMWEHMR